MRIAILHNLQRGGARRVLAEHTRHMDIEVVEFCPSTAVPVTQRPRIIGGTPLAPRVAPVLRPALRHLDFATKLTNWRRLARAVRADSFDVVLAHPCQYFQAPPALQWLEQPTVYFCHEPRRVDYESDAGASRNPSTRGLYWALYRGERAVDRRAVGAAGTLLTNSRYTAGRIRSAYGRDAMPLQLGVADTFRVGDSDVPRHLLSVGALIPTKGHDLVVEAAALAQRRSPVVVVAPRPDASAERRLRELADRRGVMLDVRIGISDAQLRDAYGGALATLYLAREEPFGLVSIEAQACGSPVIVAAEGGLPETIVNGESGWSVAREPAVAAERIDLLADASRRAAMARCAAEHGRRYTWAASAAQLQSVLARAAGR